MRGVNLIAQINIYPALYRFPLFPLRRRELLNEESRRSFFGSPCEPLGAERAGGTHPCRSRRAPRGRRLRPGRTSCLPFLPPTPGRLSPAGLRASPRAPARPPCRRLRGDPPGTHRVAGGGRSRRVCPRPRPKREAVGGWVVGGGGRGSALGGRAGLKLRRQPRPRTGTRWALRPYTNTATPEIARIGAVGTGNPPATPRPGGIVLTARFKMVTLTIKSQQQSTCPRPEHKKTTTND